MAEPDDAASELVLLPERATIAPQALLPSSYAYQFTGMEALRVSIANTSPGARIILQGRLWHPDSGVRPFAYECITFLDRSVRRERLEIGAGYLLNLSVFVRNTAPLVGQAFIQVQMVRGYGGSAYVIGTLVQGYCTHNQDLGWPGSPITDSISGGGYVRVIDGTTPAPGAEITEVVPTGARWLLLSFRASFVGPTGAGNRLPFLQYFSAGFATAIVGQAGPLFDFYNGPVVWANGVQSYSSPTIARLVAALPLDQPLLAGQEIRTSTINLQPTDTWNFIRYVVREWLEVT